MTEIGIVSFLNHFGRGTFLDAITTSISYIPLLILLWLLFALLAFRFDKKDGKAIFLSILFAVLIYFLVNDFIFKDVVVDIFGEKLRPYLAHPNEVAAIGQRLTDSSFPSGHVASSAAVLFVVTYFYRKSWPLCLIFVLFMMFTRMHLGMHYPTDVVAGLIFGIVYGAIGIFMAKKIVGNKKTA